MADLLDVMNTLVAQCTGYVYPGGTAQPPVAGAAVKVFPGWPVPAQLDTDLATAAGPTPVITTQVSVFPLGSDKNTTRYPPVAKVMSIATPTLTLQITGRTIRVGGAVPAPFTPHNMAVLLGGQPFIYPIQASDTLTSIATGLSALIAVAYPGTVNSGAVITLAADAPTPTARVGTTGEVATEWERQAQRIMISTWAPDPVTRSLISGAIKVGLAQIAFLTMVDGFGARVLAQGGGMTDGAQKAGLYRRDLIYEVEYATTTVEQTATVVALKALWQTQQGAFIASQTI